jgi:exopolysaccharide production protein ExoZ
MRRIDNIQILRGIAALMVVVHHFTVMTRPYSGTDSILRYHYLADVGASGVDIFFCISGFVMMMMVVANLQAEGGFRALDFMMWRAIRILPMYWILTTAFIALILTCNALNGSFASVFTMPLQAKFLITSYLLLPSYIPGSNTIAPILFQGWTLSYEFYFYFAVAVSACLFKKLSHIALALTAEIVGLFVAFRVLPVSKFAIQSFLSNAIVLEFLLGAGIFLLFRSGRKFPRSCALLGAFGLLATIYLPALHGHRALLWGIPAALIVLGMVTGDRKVRGSHLLMRLGNASFSIYLLHLLPLYLYGALLLSGDIASNHGQYLAIAVSVIATVLAGMAVYQWIEKPVTARLNDLYRERVRHRLLGVAFVHRQRV